MTLNPEDPHAMGARTVSHPPSSDHRPCPRCDAEMREILRIAPTMHEKGLVAYECGLCGYITSELEPAIQQRRRA